MSGRSDSRIIRRVCYYCYLVVSCHSCYFAAGQARCFKKCYRILEILAAHSRAVKISREQESQAFGGLEDNVITESNCEVFRAQAFGCSSMPLWLLTAYKREKSKFN